MKTPQQKIIVIYHGDCPDGFGGAWAAWKKFGNKAAYLPARDRFAPPCALKHKEIYLIDYTYSEETVARLIRDNVRVTAIDHHITAEAAVRMTDRYSFSLVHSGSVLAWKYFHSGKKVPFYLRCIEDMDLWNWKIRGSREILTVTGIAKQEFSRWDRIVRDLENASRRAQYKEKGKLLLQYEMALINDILPDAEKVAFEGRTVLAVNAPERFASDLGNILAGKTRSFAIIWRESKGKIKVSLRSRGGVDVSAIAKKFNGGGHRAAAGFAFDAEEKPWKLLGNGAKKKK